MMAGKGLIFVALLVACSAIPAPDESFSWFEHVDRSSRIVGGTLAAEGSHPWMVAMTSGTLIRSFMCGGSVIGLRHVLTAAHCIDAVFSWGSLSSSLRVTVGTNRWNQGGLTYRLSGNATHQNYVSSVIKNDIGILFTSADIRYSELVAPARLSYDYVDGGVPSRVAGWGRIRAGGALSATLLELDTATISGEQCTADARQSAIDLNVNAPPVEGHIEICTYHSPGFGNCNGDSGSALSRTDTGEQIGVVSWGFPCALGAPDMYARVSAYRDWILQRL